jgi:hypothetical protein
LHCTSDDEEVKYPEFLVEDEYVSEFSLYKTKKSERKVHERGCIPNDLAALVVDGGFVVGRVIGRCPKHPLTQVVVHMYGNADGKMEGTYRPCFIDKDLDRVYKKKAGGMKPWLVTYWIESIASWSCDWELTKSNHLQTSLLKRLSATPSVAYEYIPKSKAKKSRA